MALKDLLVYVDQTPDSVARLKLASDLATWTDSHLTVLFVDERNNDQLERYAAAELGLASAAQYASLDRDIERTIADAALRLRGALDRCATEHGLRFEWRRVEGSPALAVAQHARYADLCILGHQNWKYAVPVDYAFSEQVMFTAGRPVLFVPVSGAFNRLGRHIAVAWNSSRAAARALNDALQLIELSERTSVLCVNPDHYVDHHNALPPEWLSKHLDLHGVTAEIVRIHNIPNTLIAEVLQDKALSLGADMLVAGAFGHAKLREKLLGGVTCSLLEHMRLPLLMSH